MIKKCVFCLYLSVLVFAGPSYAEIIYLKNGQKIEGTIVERKANSVKINVDGIPSMYFMDEVDRIIKEEDRGVDVKEFAARPVRSLDKIPEDKKLLIHRLLEVSGSKKRTEKIFLDIYNRVPQEQLAEVKALFSMDEVLNQTVQVYDKYYTEGELVGLINFYESPVGQKLITIGPTAEQEVYKATLKYFASKEGK